MAKLMVQLRVSFSLVSEVLFLCCGPHCLLSGLLQRSPGPRQQDPFTRTNSSQTPKHPGISEEASFSLHSEDGGLMTPGLSQLDKTASNGPSAVGVSPLDGPMSMMPQLGDSEEKLRQVGQFASPSCV